MTSQIQGFDLDALTSGDFDTANPSVIGMGKCMYSCNFFIPPSYVTTSFNAVTILYVWSVSNYSKVAPMNHNQQPYFNIYTETSELQVWLI